MGAGAVLLILGTTLLAAQVLVPLAYALRGVLTSVFGIDGKLAANNIRREPRRSANTAAALMIGVMLLALTATFTESLKAVITGQFQQITAQFIVAGSQGDVPQGAIDIIAGVDGVKSVTRLSTNSVALEGTTATINDTTVHDLLMPTPRTLPPWPRASTSIPIPPSATSTAGCLSARTCRRSASRWATP